MNRLQKKCLIFSLGLHGLLVVILFAGAGFGSRPQETGLQILNMIPANIVDRAGAGGGTPVVNLAPQAQPQPRAQPRVLPQPQAARAEQVERAPTPTPRQPKEIKRPQADESEEVGLAPAPKPRKRSARHEIKPSFTLANATARGEKTGKTQSSESTARAEARAESRRLKEIQNSLDELAAGVRSSGSPNTIVDSEGIGGGEAFAGYRDVVFSAYYHAWITPDNATSRLASADAKVTIARDGSIRSAELVRPSGDRALDGSVEQALRRVTKLPPFPASTRDTQRTFVIRFSLEAKEMTG
jgi:TonB family protein